MRIWMTIAVVLGSAGAFAAPLVGQATLTLSGDPQALIVRSAVAGFAPDPVIDEGTVYSLSVSETSNIVAHLDAPLPAGVTLRVRLEPPPGSTGAGAVALTTSAQALVRLVLPGTYSGLGVRYELSSTVEGGVVPLNARQVTFTITPAQ